MGSIQRRTKQKPAVLFKMGRARYKKPMMFGCGFMYFVYVIECETPSHYYIGLTRDFDERIKQHKNRKGARFTSKHGFKRVVCKEQYNWQEDAKDRERELTQDYINKYGIENVAGAGQTQVLKGKVRGAQLGW